jgi:glycosyltransferase involved in cell wall biosynthesis
MVEPLVSVKMLTYNHAPYIAQAIEGVLQQKTNYPFELVIGEDCSTDGTREIVLEYQKKYPDIIRLVTSDRNLGMKKNSYRTTKACRGKYMAFCEGDDYWHRPDKLQKQADYLESHPECGLVYSSYDVYHVRSKKRINDFIKYRNWEMPIKPDMSDFVEGKKAMSIGIKTCTVMVRRALAEQIIESDPYLHQGDQFMQGDTQLWAEIATMSHVHYIPESLATYNVTEGSATRSKDIKKALRFSIAHAELLLYLCNKYNLPPSIRNKNEESWCNHSLRLALHTRSTELADEVRKKKKTFTWKEWLRYYGAKNLTLYYLYRLAAFFPNLFRKDQYKWKWM